MVRSFSSRRRVAAAMMLDTTATTRQRKAIIRVTNRRGGYSQVQARVMRLTAPPVPDEPTDAADVLLEEHLAPADPLHQLVQLQERQTCGNEAEIVAD